MDLDPETLEAFRSFRAAISVIQEKNPEFLRKSPQRMWSTAWADWNRLSETLNELEGFGWEIVQVFPDNDGHHTTYRILMRKEYHGSRPRNCEAPEGTRTGPQRLCERAGSVPTGEEEGVAGGDQEERS